MSAVAAVRAASSIPSAGGATGTSASETVVVNTVPSLSRALVC